MVEYGPFLGTKYRSRSRLTAHLDGRRMIPILGGWQVMTVREYAEMMANERWLAS